MSELMWVSEIWERTFGLEGEGGGGGALFVQVSERRAEETGKRVSQSLPPLIHSEKEFQLAHV